MKHFKGDLTGGMTTSLIRLPEAMALGALVFAPLGPEYIPLGIVSGLISLAISNLTTAPLGDMPVMNNAPFSLSAFMLLATLKIIIESIGGDITNPAVAATVISLLFLTTFLSGAFQCLFSILKVGSLAKYIPYPVLAGLLNGSAVVIFMSQINIFLGLPRAEKIVEIGTNISQIKIYTLVVGLSVIIFIWLGPKLYKKIPSLFYGIVGGTLVYYFLIYFGFKDVLGSVIGSIPAGIPTPKYGLEFYRVFSSSTYWPLIGQLLPLSLGIAAINSLRSMIVISVGNNLISERTNANKELFAQGSSNMLTGIFGGISTAGSMSSTLANYQYGGRTSLSRAVSGIFPILILLFLHPLVSKIPNAVLAGMLIMIAIASFDSWSVSLVSKVIPDYSKGNKNTLINLISVLAVTLSVVVLGILEALVIGLGISISLFVFKMSKSGLRRELNAGTCQSNTQREESECKLLEKEGHRIHILELEGAFFFGTADKIEEHVENLINNKTLSFLILDFLRINGIDTTGVKIIKQLIKKCKENNIALYLSSITPTKSEIYQELSNFLTIKEISTHCFTELETALSYAEDFLLDSYLDKNRYKTEMPVEEHNAFNFLNKEEIIIIKKYLVKKVFKDKEQVFKQGDPGELIYFIVQGRAQISFQTCKLDGTCQIIGTLCPGTVLGEMSFIDRGQRSTDVFAVDDLICFELSLADMNQMYEEYPELPYKILAGIAKQLSIRLRVANRIQSSLRD